MQFEKDMKSEHKELFLKVRSLLLSFEGIEEVKKVRITSYSDVNGGICHLRTMPYGVDIGFLKGAKMLDDKRVLSGNGKAVRVLKVTNFDEVLIGNYVGMALQLNAK